MLVLENLLWQSTVAIMSDPVGSDRCAAASPPDGEACARPARPTRSLRAPHQHDFDARAFTRALCAGSQNHAGPANLLSCASRLSGLYASLRPSARPRVRFGLARAPHEPPTSGGYRRGSIPRYDAGTPLLLNNHEPTILRVEYKDDTISTKPSYFSFLSGRPHSAGILV